MCLPQLSPVTILKKRTVHIRKLALWQTAGAGKPQNDTARRSGHLHAQDLQSRSSHHTVRPYCWNVVPCDKYLMYGHPFHDPGSWALISCSSQIPEKPIWANYPFLSDSTAPLIRGCSQPKNSRVHVPAPMVGCDQGSRKNVKEPINGKQETDI